LDYFHSMRKPYLYIIYILSIFFVLIQNTSLAAPVAKTSATPIWILPRTYDIAKKPQAKHIENGEYFILFDEQVNVQEKARYRKVIKKIVNESGVQSNSELSFSFSAAYQQIVFHEFNILRDGKKINKLNVSKIKVINDESSLSDHQLSGQYNALIILEDLRKGDLLEYSYSVIGENPIYNNLYSDLLSFASYSLILYNNVSVLMPAGKPLYYKLHNGSLAPRTSTRNGYDVYDWPSMELEPYDFSTNTPSWYVSYPYVEVSEFKDWKQVNNWALGLVNNYNYKLPADLLGKIKQWQEEAHGDLSVFAGKATRFVQDDIRYMGIEVGENSHKPHEPTETYNKRYGDCKDKSILLVMILRQANIPAYSALVNTYLGTHLIERLPNADLFDHVIVKLKLDNEDFYIDPTISLQRAAFKEITLPPYGMVLSIEPDNNSPEKILTRSRAKTTITEYYKIPEDNKQKATLGVSTVYEFADADDMRSTLSNSSMKNIEKSYVDYYKATHKYTSADSINHTDDEELNVLTVSESYTIDSIWENNDKSSYIYVPAKPILEKLTDPTDHQKGRPFKLNYPVDISYTATYEMPSPWGFEDEGFTISNEYYSYGFKPMIEGDKVILIYYFKTFQDHIPAEYVDRYKKDYEKITSSMDYNLTQNNALLQKLDSINKKGLSSQINWIALFLCIAAITGAFFIFRHFNKMSDVRTSHFDTPNPYTWWLILLFGGLTIRIFVYTYNIYDGGYLTTTYWVTLNELGETGLLLIVMLEMIVLCGFLMYSVWVFYWLIQKRDIFPKMFLILMFSELGYNVLMLILSTIFEKELSNINYNLTSANWTSVMRSLISTAIWGAAVYKSADAKRIFIKPYKYKFPRNAAYEYVPYTKSSNYPENMPPYDNNENQL